MVANFLIIKKNIFFGKIKWYVIFERATKVQSENNS
jgi:hypothetical protein